MTNKDRIVSELDKEEIRFSNTLQQGLKEFEKVITHIPTKTISGKPRSVFTILSDSPSR